VKITLALKPILQALPPFQLSGDPESIPAEGLIELPFSLIEPQLATGRITLTSAVFAAALPAEYRGLFQAGEEPVDVILPLHDVLKNLPVASLRMRDDQELQEAGASFSTPFSAKAEEDAKRFNLAGPVAKPAEGPAMAAGDPQPDAAPVKKPFELEPVPLPVASEADEKLDAKVVITQLNKLAGVQACALMFGDGLSLAGSLPAEFETDGLCAMAPSLMQRLDGHMVETKLGLLGSMTLSCAKGAVSFFMHKNLCLAAFHSGEALATEVREELARVVHEVSRKYSHPV
jgi:predicted regulator of Ras-like GTPase activity (Roadblock/LC7/MglB family)